MPGNATEAEDGEASIRVVGFQYATNVKESSLVLVAWSHVMKG